MEKVKKSFLNAADIVIFMIIIFVKVIGLNFAIKIIHQGTIGLVIGAMGSAFIIASLVSLFKGKTRFRTMVTFDIIVSIILMTDLVYNRYFYDVTSVAVLQQARIAGEVKDSVLALIHPTDFLFFIDLLLIIPFKKRIRNKMDSIKYPGIGIRGAVLLVLFIVGYFLSYNSVDALAKNQPGILKTFYDKKYVVATVGDLNFHMMDFYRYITNNVLKTNKLTDEDKKKTQEWFNKKNIAIKNAKYKGAMKGKNLIIVQLEAFQSFPLNKKINGQEITPNLNKLQNDSLVFDNYYYGISMGGTSDAEFLSNVSLLPAREGSVYYQYAGNTYDSMIKYFNNMGYYTTVMHANRPGFWNRANMYKSYGFDKFEDENSYNKDEVIGLGLSDESFFKQSTEKMKSFKQPFYSFMISLSSHFPFKDPKLNNILNVGQFEGTMMGDYLKSVKYTDGAIGQLINELKAEGLWDNSVVVFYGDHNAIPLEKKDQLAKFLYNRNDMSDLEWRQAQKVVAMIHFPKNEIKGHMDMTASQMDLFPTIANLYGFTPKYVMGQDLLNAKDGFFVNREGSWADNNVVYVKSADKVYDIKTGKELNKDDYKNQFERALEYLKNSDNVIENDLIKSFEGKK